MRYVPSPTPLKFSWVFTATSNSSGRMQYHRIKPGESKVRITRNEFIKAFNTRNLIAVRPLPLLGDENLLQLEFYI